MSDMRFVGKAQEIGERIVEAFRHPEELPAALATIWLKRIDSDRPCDRWSFANRLLAVFYGNGDARGFRQWLDVGRAVKKGERAFGILVPLRKKVMVRDDATGEEKVVEALYGFGSAPVFGIQQTEGEDLPTAEDPERQAFLASLPFREVAEHWGLKVGAVGGRNSSWLGKYRQRVGIVLAVENLCTWTHELMHAADDRLIPGGLSGGQHASQEVVAEFGAAILLSIAGMTEAADLGGVRNYVASYSGDPAAACVRLLDRTCRAVSLILQTAEDLHEDAVRETCREALA